MILAEVGAEEELEGFVGPLVLVEEFFEDGEGAEGVEEGVVPIAIGLAFLDGGGNAEEIAEGAEGVILGFWPGGAGEVEGVEPGCEGVAGEGAEEALFGAVAVGDDNVSGEEAADDGPE